MNKLRSVKVKQFLATVTISAALVLSIAVQHRGGYISSTGRTDTNNNITTQETISEEITEGNGTMGSGESQLPKITAISSTLFSIGFAI